MIGEGFFLAFSLILSVCATVMCKITEQLRNNFKTSTSKLTLHL